MFLCSVQQRNDYYVKCVAEIGQFKLTVMTAIYINTSKDTEADRHLKKKYKRNNDRKRRACLRIMGLKTLNAYINNVLFLFLFDVPRMIQTDSSTDLRLFFVSGFLF